MNDLDPVVLHFEVPLQPEEAFAVFTTELGTWWPFAGHSCTDDVQATVHFDARVGGEVSESSSDGNRHFIWGTISEWHPPQRFSMSWHPGQPAEQATRLTVSFAQSLEGCKVTLVHDGWAARGESGAAARGMYAKGWIGVTHAYIDKTKVTS